MDLDSATYSIQGLLAGSPMGAWTVRFPGLFMLHPDITAYIISAGTSLSHSAPAPPSPWFFCLVSSSPRLAKCLRMRDTHMNVTLFLVGWRPLTRPLFRLPLLPCGSTPVTKSTNEKGHHYGLHDGIPSRGSSRTGNVWNKV